MKHENRFRVDSFEVRVSNGLTGRPEAVIRMDGALKIKEFTVSVCIWGDLKWNFEL